MTRAVPLLLLASCGSPTPPAAHEPAPEPVTAGATPTGVLRIAFTGRGEGEIEPCG